MYVRIRWQPLKKKKTVMHMQVRSVDGYNIYIYVWFEVIRHSPSQLCYIRRFVELIKFNPPSNVFLISSSHANCSLILNKNRILISCSTGPEEIIAVEVKFHHFSIN